MRSASSDEHASVSAASVWQPLAAFVDREARLGAWVRGHGPVAAACYEFLRFGVKQGWACLFGALLLALIIATRL